MKQPAAASERARVLCVDDEPRVLEGLRLTLRRAPYVLSTAGGGAEGLELLRSEGPFAAVVSDMRMPGMNGAEFLARVRVEFPDTTRVLLTGQADLASAIAAVNEGQIFRFLTKPCPRDQLEATLRDAVEQHRLVTAERVLLERTLRGSVKALCEALELVNPVASGRSARVARQVEQVAEELGLEDRWSLEVAARVSQLGYIALPPETAEKVYQGVPLSSAERGLLARVPTVARTLLGPIPRLEPVLALLGSRESEGSRLPPAASVLEIALELDAYELQGIPPRRGLERLRRRADRYDPEAFAAFERLHQAQAPPPATRTVPLRSVRVGTVLAEDLRLWTGALLVRAGYEVTQSFLERIRNFPDDFLAQEVRVEDGAAQPACAERA